MGMLGRISRQAPYAKTSLCVQRAALSALMSIKANPDWNRMMALASTDEEKDSIATARKSLNQLETLVAETEQPAKPIDWKHWEETISDASLVREFKAGYSKLKFEGDIQMNAKIMASMEIEHKAASKQIILMVDQIKESIESLEAQKSEIQTSKDELWSATVESVLAKNPQLNQRFNEEIKNDNWF